MPTTKKTIRRILSDKDHKFIFSVFRLFTCEPQSNEYKNNLLIAAIILENIGALVYKGADGKYHKLSDKIYRTRLFEAYSETPEEIQEYIARYGKILTEDESKQIHKMIWQIADLICPMLTSMSEQGFVSEYAYAIDYVIRHNGNLESPVIGHFFPSNYPDYKYDEGIAKDIHEYEIM